MAAVSHKELLEWLRKSVQVVLIVVGTVFAVYNLSAFKVDQYGLYYVDANQLWLAFGAGLLALNWIIRNWKTL
jgi:uncharacterized membrane protein (Fun14 family)